MAFSFQTWKDKFSESLWSIRMRVQEAGADSVYYAYHPTFHDPEEVLTTYHGAALGRVAMYTKCVPRLVRQTCPNPPNARQIALHGGHVIKLGGDTGAS